MKYVGMFLIWINCEGEFGYYLVDYEIRMFYEFRKILGVVE